MTITELGLLGLAVVGYVQGYGLGRRHGAMRVALDMRHGVKRAETVAALKRLDKMLGKDPKAT